MITMHTIELSNPTGRSMRLTIRLDGRGQGTWRTLDKGGFCYEGGVVDTGYEPLTNPLAWVALYGGNVVDDANLVLHLDNYLGYTGVSHQGGEGLVYAQDDLVMPRGKVHWRLVH